MDEMAIHVLYTSLGVFTASISVCFVVQSPDRDRRCVSSRVSSLNRGNLPSRTSRPSPQSGVVGEFVFSISPEAFTAEIDLCNTVVVAC